MRFIIYGAGGIGGSLGARLHQNNLDVVLIARGEHAEVMRRVGMHFVTPNQNAYLRIPTVSHPNEISFGSDDVIILCMKSQHTESALRDLQGVVNDSTPVVCCQNGVANERMALRRFQNVYGMVVWVPAEHLRPGEVINFAEKEAGILDAGRYPSGIDDTIEQITSVINTSGFISSAQVDIMQFKYSKLLNNLSNSINAATGGGSREIAAILRDEALTCYRAAGIQVAEVGVNNQRRRRIGGGPIEGYERHGGSSLQSIMRGTGDIEVDYLNGEITQLGRQYGIPTPANLVAQRIGVKLVADNLDVGAYSIDEIFEEIRRETDRAPVLD